jgi:hypothetical protein
VVRLSDRGVDTGSVFRETGTVREGRREREQLEGGLLVSMRPGGFDGIAVAERP